MRIDDALWQEVMTETPVCFFCGERKSTDAHHGVITAEKKFSKWLNVMENLVGSCHQCNIYDKGHLENYNTRKTVYEYKVSLGYNMAAWIAGLPFKVKERFE
jgi:putative heme degradation protein